MLNVRARIIAATSGALLVWAVPASAQITDCQQAPSILDGGGEIATAVRSVGDVRYVSGGIGADEAAAMRALRQQYPLALSFAERSGGRNAFVASVYVSLSRQDGSTLLCVVTSGPYLFLDLPPGRYRVTANAPQRSELVRQVNVVAGRHQDVAMIWTTPRPDTGAHAPLVSPPEPVIIRTVVAPPGAAPATTPVTEPAEPPPPQLAPMPTRPEEAPPAP